MKPAIPFKNPPRTDKLSHITNLLVRRLPFLSWPIFQLLAFEPWSNDPVCDHKGNPPFAPGNLLDRVLIKDQGGAHPGSPSTQQSPEVSLCFPSSSKRWILSKSLQLRLVVCHTVLGACISVLSVVWFMFTGLHKTGRCFDRAGWKTGPGLSLTGWYFCGFPTKRSVRCAPRCRRTSRWPEGPDSALEPGSRGSRGHAGGCSVFGLSFCEVTGFVQQTAFVLRIKQPNVCT